MKRPPAALILLTALTIPVACNSGPEVAAVDPTASTTVEPAAPTTIATTTSTQPAQEFPGGEIALAYFDDIATSSNSEHAEPGSPAAHYALYLEQISSTDPPQTGIVEGDGDKVLVTSQYPDATSGRFAYSDIEVSPDGVRTFTVEGNPLNDHIAATTEPVSNGPVEIRSTISYLSISGSHFITLSVTNTGETTFNAFNSAFVDEAGQQSDMIAYLNNADIRPGATGILAMEFPSAETPAGTLYLDGVIDDYNTPLTFTIPIPPLP